MRTLRQPYAPGFLTVGDAAGFLINNGYTFRGVDLAIASGAAAAEAAIAAMAKHDLSEVSLSVYEKILRRKKILTDLQTFGRSPQYMSNPRLFSTYPRLICDLVERLYKFEGKGKQKVLCMMLEELKAKDVSVIGMLSDLMGGALSM